MLSLIRKISTQQAAFAVLAVLLIVVLLRPTQIQAQKAAVPAAQVNLGSPLPVYVVNDPKPALPDGFVPGSTWKFTTWTIPSTITFTASVQKTDGGWASLALTGDPPTTPRWYYIPQMPGAWEMQ